MPTLHIKGKSISYLAQGCLQPIKATLYGPAVGAKQPSSNPNTPNLSQPKIWQPKKQLKGLPSDYGKNNFVVDTNR